MSPVFSRHAVHNTGAALPSLVSSHCKQFQLASSRTTSSRPNGCTSEVRHACRVSVGVGVALASLGRGGGEKDKALWGRLKRPSKTHRPDLLQSRSWPALPFAAVPFASAAGVFGRIFCRRELNRVLHCWLERESLLREACIRLLLQDESPQSNKQRANAVPFMHAAKGFWTYARSRGQISLCPRRTAVDTPDRGMLAVKFSMCCVMFELLFWGFNRPLPS